MKIDYEITKYFNENNMFDSNEIDGLIVKVDSDNIIIQGDARDLVELADILVSISKNRGSNHIHLDNSSIINESSQIKEIIIEKLQFSIDIASLDEPIKEDTDDTLGDFIIDPQSTEDIIDSICARYELLDAIEKNLTKREKKVILERNGIINGKLGDRRTLEAIVIDFHVTKESIRQVEARAYRKLRHPRVSKRLKTFL